MPRCQACGLTLSDSQSAAAHPGSDGCQQFLANATKAAKAKKRKRGRKSK